MPREMLRGACRAWLGEGSRASAGSVRGEGVGGVISLRADRVHLQLYASCSPSTSTSTFPSPSASPLAPDTHTTALHSTEAALGTGVATGDIWHVDFAIHLCVFEACMMNEDCEDEEDDGEEDGGRMAWSKLTVESLQQLSSVELALHYKQIVLHLIAMRSQVQSFAARHSLDHVANRNIGLVYGQHSRNLLLTSSPSPSISSTHYLNTSQNMSLEKYHPEIPRQFQYRPQSNKQQQQHSRRKLGTNAARQGQEPGQERFCGTVTQSRRDNQAGHCFTQMGDGTTRGVFRRDAMIIEYLPDLQVGKEELCCLLSCVCYAACYLKYNAMFCGYEIAKLLSCLNTLL